MVPRPPSVSCLEMMGEVDSLRMGYWHLAMSRGEVHDAHNTLKFGFQLLELLRWHQDFQLQKPEVGKPGGGYLPDVAYLFVLAIKVTAEKCSSDLNHNRYYQRALRLHRQLCGLYSSRPPADDISFGISSPSIDIEKGKPPPPI